MALNFKDYTLLKKEYIKSINSMLDKYEDLSFFETIKQCWKETLNESKKNK